MTHANVVEIPWDRLTDAQRLALAESFILREGTDYGLVEKTHETKVERLLALVCSGQAHIIFDLGSETFNFVTHEDWKRLMSD